MANGGLGLQNLLPLLAEKKKQADVEARRQERTGKITDIYQTIYGGEGTREEKIRAMAQGATMGINFPQSVLKDRGSKKGVVELLTYLKSPQEVIDAFETDAIDRDEAINLGSKLGDQLGMDLETVQRLFELDPRLAQSGKTPEQLVAQTRLVKRVGVEAANKMMGIKTPGADKESALSEKRRAVKSIIGDRNIAELLEDPKALAELEVTGVSQPELLAMFGVDRKAIIDAQTAIDAEMSAVDPEWKYRRGPTLLKWIQGDREGISKSLLKLLDKYYVPGQDSMKPEGTIEKADELMNLALDRAMGGKPAEEVPEKYRGRVLRLFESGMTKDQFRKLYNQAKSDSSKTLNITEEEFKDILKYLP